MRRTGINFFVQAEGGIRDSPESDGVEDVYSRRHEDNEHEDNEHEDNEHEDNEHEDNEHEDNEHEELSLLHM